MQFNHWCNKLQKAEFTSLKKDIHLLYCLNFCTGGRLDLHKYHQKYPDAVARVENNPQLADKNSKDFYYIVEEQGAALLQYFRSNIILAKRVRESGNTGMRKRFQSPRVSRAKPLHLLSLPPPGLSIQYQTFDDAEPSPSKAPRTRSAAEVHEVPRAPCVHPGERMVEAKYTQRAGGIRDPR